MSVAARELANRPAEAYAPGSRPGVARTEEYRPDIDGLRAVAVIAVVLYHAFPRAVPSGFVGVDVFFVISGFLITRLILQARMAGTFRVAEFYDRRIRRIVPALALVLVAILVGGWIILFPDEFITAGRDVAAGATFSSNLVFFHFRNLYFDTPADRNPLIHLWSLGVEEQFYLVWPWMLLLLVRLRAPMRFAIATLAVASLVSIPFVQAFRSAAPFYMPITRGWELMIGAFLGIAGMPRPATAKVASAIGAIGLAAIISSAFVVPRDAWYPGPWTLLPTIGAALVIASGPEAATNRRPLSNSVVVSIGLISYPLYLWHWPLLVALKLFRGTPSPIEVATAIAAALLLAVATYRFVELPVRTRRPRSARLPLLGALAVLLVGGLLAYHRHWTPRSDVVLDAQNDWAYPGNGKVTPLGTQLHLVSSGASNPSRTVLFIGDSHVEQYWPRVEMLGDRLQRDRVRVEFVSRRRCPLLPGIERRLDDHQCQASFDTILELARSSEANTIVFGAYWEGYFLPPFRWAGEPRLDRALYLIGDARHVPLTAQAAESAGVFQKFGDAIRSLRAAGKTVVILGSNPTGREYSPRSMINRASLKYLPYRPVLRSQFAAYLSPVVGPLRAAAAEGGARFIDPMDFLCDSRVCPVRTASGHPMNRDDNHIRAEVARSITLVDSVLWGGERR